LALIIGALVGALAGSRGSVERLLMLAADVIVVLPGAYSCSAARTAADCAQPDTVFVLMTILRGSVWPHVARGVRAIVARTDARLRKPRASGAGPLRRLALLPAARGFLARAKSRSTGAAHRGGDGVIFGLGFVRPTASWGLIFRTPATSR
jgi:ABC-type dipeptide/oligopeptide/nickel transport system permease subunit